MINAERKAELQARAYEIARRAVEDEANEWMTLEEQVYHTDEEWNVLGADEAARMEELEFVAGVLTDIAESL